MKYQKYEVGDRITLPPKEGVTPYKRNGTVIGIYKHFYLVLTDSGYRECVLKSYTPYEE